MTTVHFIHMTDLHISHPELDDKGLDTDTTATLATVIDMVNVIDPRPSFAVISGDLTNRGDAESYRFLRDMLRSLEVPVILALGNHDARDGFYSGMLERGTEETAPYCHDTMVDGVHVVTLDTSIPGKIGGAISEEQFAFLDEALGRHPESQKILVMHHAPTVGEDCGYQWERLSMGDSDRLLAAIKGRNVAGILTGHIHYDRVSCWHGIPVVVGNGHHNAVDPTFRNGLRIMAGASFGFCSLRDSGLTVSFVPLPSDRRVLRIASEERVRSLV